MNAILRVNLALLIASAAWGQTALRTPSQPQDAPTDLSDRAVRRVRAIEVDPAVFSPQAAKQAQSRLRATRQRTTGAAPLTTSFTLFDDVTLNVNWLSVSQSDDLRAHIWSGAVAGSQSGGAVIVVEGNRVSANLTRGDGIMYQVRTRDDGTQWVRELDQKQFPEELPPAPEPASHAIRATQSQPDLRQAVTPQPAADDGSVVDVMVVYTASARNKAGGPDAMRQLIQLGVAETNQGYSNSGVVQRIRLVNTAEVPYVESGDLGKDLDRLQAPSDGFLDDIQRLRDSAAADIVSLWVNGGDACGIAYLLTNPSRPSPDLAYNVTEMGCATGYFSFGHEMGHNMGTSHGRDDGTGPGAFPYSYAFKKTTGNKFRTIMGYNTNCSCPRVNYWSNPLVTYDGTAVGIDSSSANSAANYLTLNNTRQIVAAYRQSVPAGGSGGSGGGGSGLPESLHPYKASSDQTISYTVPGNPTSLNVTFDARTYVEAGYDFLYVLDANNTQIAGSPFTGNSLAGKTVTVPGATVRIRLVSDDSTEGFGFLVSAVTGNAFSGGGAGLPKLVVTALTSPLNARAGGPIPGVRSQIVNQGTAPAAAFRVGFYLSQRLPVTTADKFTGWSCNFPNGLSAGQAITCNGDLGLPLDVVPGQYYFAAIADDLNALQQSDRAGNSRASDSGQLTITGGSPGDLTSPPTGSQLTSTTATFRWSQGIGVSRFILAIGTTSGGRDLFFRDMGTSLSAEVSGLPSNGGAIFATLTSQVGTDARSTVYYFRALNQPSGSASPKLVVSSLTAPTAASPGVPMEGMNVAIENQGAVPSGPFRIGFYFGRSENITPTSATFSGSFCNYPEGLAAGATASCAGQVSVPNTLSSGTWYFAAIADDLNQLRQPDPSASTRLADTGPIAVSGRSPATILSPVPEATLTGASVTLRWNAGSGVDEYYLSVGTTSGGNEIYEGNQGQSLSVTVNNLPTDGRSLYVRLVSKLGEDWLYYDYRYRAFSSGATGTLPRLVVTQLTAPTSGVVGANLAGTRLAITNSGNANAGPFRIGYYYSKSRNVTTSDVFSGWSCTLAQGLAAGASFTCNGDIGVPTTLTPGVWYLAAIADDRNVITQSDRAANTRIADSGAITFAATAGGGGGALPESRHPYLSDTDQSWTYRYPTEATAIRVRFSAETEVEQDYDFIAIYDGAGRQIPGSPFSGTSLAGTTVTVPGNIVRIRLVSDDSLEFYGFKVASITESLGVDLPESTHPYDNDKDVYWTYTHPGNPLAIQLKFDDRTALEDGFDFVGVYDAGGRHVTGSPFTGRELAGKSVLVPGNVAIIRLLSDDSENDWGFAVVKVDAVNTLPRLAVTSFTAPVTGRIGSTLTGMRAVTTNQGNARAGAFRVGFYWSQSPNVSVTDVFSGWSCTAANGVEPAATFACSGEFGIPASLSPGRWYVAAIADDRFAVPQIDRTGAARTNENGSVLLGVADVLRDGSVIPQFGFDGKSDATSTRALDAPTEGSTRMAPKTTQHVSGPQR